MIQRHRKLIAAALVGLNLCGARAVVFSQPCGSNGVFFTPSQSFRSMVKTALQQDRRHASERSLGSRTHRLSSHDFKFLAVRRVAAPAAALVPAIQPVAVATPLPDQSFLWQGLPADLSPVQPPHLHSKK
ncbi:MAG: hypothetical protein PHU21_01005 [Elusimicrobia bacterium]|nr:hypothetical protein [Elusimicrobiota bacterium]